MALSGNQKAYLQARSGIARSGASRSNYVVPLLGVITVGGIDITPHVLYGTLAVSLQLNEQPDTCSFDVMLTDNYVDSALEVGADVAIGLGGPAENLVFGGRILTTQTTCGPARGPHKRSVMCADYLQVVDSEYLVTYDWPPQSATTTILDLVSRFVNRSGGVGIVTTAVQAGLPSHAAVAVANERFSTVMRRLVTMFPTGGGFYIDPGRVLHAWAGASEPGVTHPSMLTLDNPMLKSFAETVDNAQQRDAVIVEGLRTTAPMGTQWNPATDPAFLLSGPVEDASILDKITDTGGRDREVRIGTQRLAVRYAEGAWSTPAGTPQTAVVTADTVFPPVPGSPTIYVDSTACLTGRSFPWVRIDEQYLMVKAYSGAGVTPAFLSVQESGWGAPIGPIKAGAVVTAIDSLGDLLTTGRYDVVGSPERIRPQPLEADVVMTARHQTPGLVHEQLVQDGRYSRSGATARAAQEEIDFNQALISIQFETDDLNAKPGRLQTYHIPDPVVTLLQGEYMILSAELSWPVWGEVPRRVCTAAEVRSASVLDTWLVDTR